MISYYTYRRLNLNYEYQSKEDSAHSAVLHVVPAWVAITIQNRETFSSTNQCESMRIR